MDAKFNIIKMYTNITFEEFNNSIEELENIDSSEIMMVDDQKFYPFVYETIDDQTYRFDGYDVTTLIDGYKDNDHSGFLQPMGVVKYRKTYKKSVQGASASLKIYNSLPKLDKEKPKYLEIYKMNKKFSDFYRALLKALQESE